jgi:hypothetical protein
MMIQKIEDGILKALRAIGGIKTVKSMGRDTIPTQFALPAAFAFFVSETAIQDSPRRIFQARFDIILLVRNLAGEKQVADDAYSLLDTVRDAVTNEDFEVLGVGGLKCFSREISGYGNGTISYALKFRTNTYLPIMEA